MRGNIAIIGDSDSIVGFRAVGFKTVAVRSGAEVAAAVDALIHENCFVIFITEQALEGAEDVLSIYADRSIPAIIPIPGRFGKTGIGMENLRRSVEQALGTDVFS